MPNLDATGPEGKGPLTGRRRGRCRDIQTVQTEKSEKKSAEDREIGYGFGFGRRFGSGGRGMGNRNKGAGRGFGRR